MSEDYIQQILTKNNLSLTVQRRVILRVLNDVFGHMTAEKVFIEVIKTIPHISLGTVYRNLEKLVEVGLVDQLKISSNKALFEIKKPPHYHIVCLKCNKIDDLTGVHINQIENQIAQHTGYNVTQHSLYVSGYCPSCRTKTIPIQDLSEES